MAHQTAPNAGAPTASGQRQACWRFLLASVAMLVALGLIAVVAANVTRPPAPRRHPLPPDTGLAHVVTTRTLRVALDASYPPFEVAAPDGTVHGFDVDLAQRIALALEVKAEFLNLPRDELPDALIAGKADVIISSLHPDNRLGLAFSHPYYNAGQVLIVPAGDHSTSGLAGLAGQPVGVELGSDADELLRTLHTPPIRVQRFDSVTTAVQALEQGRLAGVVTDAPTVAALQRQDSPIRVAGLPLSDEPYVVAAARQNLSLIRAINGVLATLQRSGELETLAKQDL